MAGLCNASAHSPAWQPPCTVSSVALPAASTHDIGFDITSGVVTFPQSSPSIAAGKAPVFLLHNGFMLADAMYQHYAILLAKFGFVVVQYNLPHLKRTDFDTEASSLPRLLDWVQKQIHGSHVSPDWSTIITAGHSRGGWIAFKQLQHQKVITAALLDAVAPPGAQYHTPSDTYLVVEGMRSPVCAPSALGFLQRRFEKAPTPLPLTRLKMPQAGHMQFCKTGASTPFWNVVCGCGHSSGDCVQLQAAALLVGYLLENGYSTLPADVVSTSIAAFQTWRHGLLKSGTLEDFGNNAATYDKTEVEKLNKFPSFVHDIDDMDGDDNVNVSEGGESSAVNSEQLSEHQTLLHSTQDLSIPAGSPAGNFPDATDGGSIPDKTFKLIPGAPEVPKVLDTNVDKLMFAQKPDQMEADLMAQRVSMENDVQK